MVSIFDFLPRLLGHSCFPCLLSPLTFSCYFRSFTPLHVSFRRCESVFELFPHFFLLAVPYQLLACSSQSISEFETSFFANWITCALSLSLAARFIRLDGGLDAHLLAVGMYYHGDVSIEGSLLSTASTLSTLTETPLRPPQFQWRK